MASQNESIDPQIAEAERLKKYLEDVHQMPFTMEIEYYLAVVRYINGEDFMPQITDYKEISNG